MKLTKNAAVKLSDHTPITYLLTMTDLRIGHGLGPRGPRNSFLWQLNNTNFKFAKPRRGITSQFTLKQGKCKRYRKSYQNRNNKIILFIRLLSITMTMLLFIRVLQYLAVLRCSKFLSVEAWTSSKKVLLERFDIEEHDWAREGDAGRLHESRHKKRMKKKLQ